MKHRGGPPTRVDFPSMQRPACAPGSWEAIQVAQARAEARYARERHLDAQPDLRVTDDVRRALVRGKGLVDTRALQEVRAWLDDDRSRPCVIVAGNQGCGKSVAAAWVIAKRGGVWLRAERAVRAFDASFGPQHALQLEALNCGTLVLEDVGTELDPQKMCAVLIEMLEQRKSRRHRTLITTNLRRAVFSQRYPDPRLLSRVGEIGTVGESVQWVTIAGADLRRSEGQR